MSEHVLPSSAAPISPADQIETADSDPRIKAILSALGARRADDGHWYVRDPDRPGKYLRANIAALLKPASEELR